MTTLLHKSRVEIALGAIILFVALTLRPYIDLSRGDFSYYLQAKSFAEFRLDIPIPNGVKALSSDMAFKDGRYYSHYPPGASLLLVPFYWTGHALDVILRGRLGSHRSDGWTVGRGAFVATHLANLAFVAGLLLALRRLSGLLDLSASGTLFAAVLVIFVSPLWHQSGHLGTQLPSTMLTLAATALVLEAQNKSWRKLALAGAAGGATLLIRPINVVILGLLGLYVLTKCRRHLVGAVMFAGPLLIGALLTLWFNAATFGDPFESGYLYDIDYGRQGRLKTVFVDNQNPFSLSFMEGFVGLTIGAISGDPPVGNRVRTMTLPSWTLPWDRIRGLFLLMPVIVFGVPGFRRWWRDGKRGEAILLGGQLVVLLFVYSKYLFWYTNSHVPLPNRYLCEGYPGWCLAVAAYAEQTEGWKRLLLRWTTSWSVGVQALVMLSLYVNYLTGINIVALETYKVLALLLVASTLAVWIYGRLSVEPPT